MKKSKNELVIKSMDFALNILKKDDSFNALVSPVSVFMALGMLTNGAAGDTREELLKAVSMDMDEFNNAMTELIRSTSKDDEQLKLANGIWVNGADKLIKEYKKKMKEEYRAKLCAENFSVETANEINKFVSKNTKGMINRLVDMLPPASSMILVNALSFCGKWDKPFKEFQVNTEGVFTNVFGKKKRVTMLNGTAGRYFEVKGGKGFLYPYENEKYIFAALLPDRGMSVDDVLKASEATEITDALRNAIHTHVDIGIPEYTLDFETELSGIMKGFGVNNAFLSGKADFSEMLKGNGEDFISQIIHKTHIELDREGTRAAAITGVMVLGAAPPIPGRNKEVILDRPFIYFILDNADKIPVFAGRVDDIGN
ncbi:serpin family protein [Butyrivibrio sp. WCD3002]|uniref:serpin family protein n=1 Tax=Butyrivibrio sp. WCD3002 TaxID=1280676 RepID=UPI00047DCD00|nr:serpin family protein [Butyrivibrio sp. WCD3002]